MNAINTRLEAATITHILEHSGARVLFVDRDSTTVVNHAIELMTEPPLLISIDDIEATGDSISTLNYENFIDTTYNSVALPRNYADWSWKLPADEWQSFSINYTSGTTGKPKGVVYHHRGATMNALSNITGWHMELILFIFGHCLCFTATVGAYHGHWPQLLVLAYAHEQSQQRLSITTLTPTALRIFAARP